MMFGSKRTWMPWCALLAIAGFVDAGLLRGDDDGAPAPPRELVDPKKMVEAADEFAVGGKTVDASRLYRKALFVQPKNGKALQGWRKIRKERAARLVGEGAAAWDTEPARALALFRGAAGLDASNSKVKALGREHGFQEFRGEWRSKNEIEEYRKQLSEIEGARKQQVNVDESYSVIYRGPFRFFTDVDTRVAKSTLEQMTASIETHWAKYREVMAPFELRTVSDLDVVLFAKRADYMKSAGIPGSAGVYYSSRGVGYFFGEGGWNFSTMLHEMTHQLNDKLLGAHGVEAWYEEGVAEYFGAGFLTQAGRRVELGRVDAYRLAAFQESVRGSAGRVIPLDRFVRMERAELSGEFYAQAWALVHYLMEVHPFGRCIIFDYLEGHRIQEGRHLAEVLSDYRYDLGSFEEEFLGYYRSGGAAGQ